MLSNYQKQQLYEFFYTSDKFISIQSIVNSGLSANNAVLDLHYSTFITLEDIEKNIEYIQEAAKTIIEELEDLNDYQFIDDGETYY